MNEFKCIETFFAPLSKGIDGTLGLQDDAALIDLGGDQFMTITSDICVEGVHFPENTSPEIIAKRALRANLSDLAAMGAVPLGYNHALAIPKNINEAWMKKYSEGLAKDQEAFSFHLLGGDTVLTPGPIMVAITAFGRVQKGYDMKRSDAKNGDRVFITGPIGDAYIGLRILQGEYKSLDKSSKNYFLSRYYLPSPRIKASDKLKQYINAAIDCSDGLIGDLGHICHSSKVHAYIDLNKVTFSEPAQKLFTLLSEEEQKNLKKKMITAGDDYELIYTIPPDKCEDAIFSSQIHDVPIYHIGQLGLMGGEQSSQPSSSLITLLDEQDLPLELKNEGYQHTW